LARCGFDSRRAHHFSKFEKVPGLLIRVTVGVLLLTLVFLCPLIAKARHV